MTDALKANYLPLATERTKHVVRHMHAGTHAIIDLINCCHPFDRKEADAWVTLDTQGLHLFYCEGGRSASMELDHEEQMRITVEERAPADDQRAPR